MKTKNKQLKYLCLLWICTFLAPGAFAQSFRFAHITDTHVGSATGADDLRRTVKDINSLPDIAFVIHSGDVTEFGSDDEIRLSKQILDSLQVPLYIVPGNHDGTWSEKGGNTFRTVFGAETFDFEYHGYRFVGTNCGPNMRMSPGQVPRENLVWLDSLFSAQADPEKPLIYINHYPQDSSLNNWYEALDRIKTQNIQLLLCGHGHRNKKEVFEDIPSIMGRSNLRAADSVGGYNLVTVADGKVTYQERHPGLSTGAAWATVELANHHFNQEKRAWPRPDFSVNSKYPAVKPAWTFEDKSDVGAGMALYKQYVIASNTAGEVYALRMKDGHKEWSFKTGGKIYSTPAVWKQYVVFGSSDHYIYCLSASSGKLLWKYQADKPVLGSALVHGGIAFIGASDHHFRAFDLATGKLKWSFDEVKGHVTDKPLYYQDKIYVGSWGNGFYALDAETGILKWSWDSGYSNRMFSAAACNPLGANGRIFIVAPDNYMTAFDAASGSVLWRKHGKDIRVRESMGLSEDSSQVYVKTMEGRLLGISTQSNEMEISWRSSLQLPYDITPSAIVAYRGNVFTPSHAGLLSDVNAKDGSIRWQYKVSNAMVNPVLPIKKNKVVLSTMDGKIVCLDY